jgi:uncharacterized protein (DUF1501 family)
MSDSLSCGCSGFSRAELLRIGAASAGQGLRAIEPGMPTPAGTGLSRRSFLARSAGMALAVFGGAALAPGRLEAGIEAAMAAGPQPILVSVFLPGGMDSLSLLAPVGDAAYAGLRPTLRAAASDALVFAGDDRLQWHPKAAPLQSLYDAGRLMVIPAIGYADPNQSHFTSRHYWEVGALDPGGQTGWLGRYLDRHGVADNPLQGLSLDSTLAPALASGSVPVAAVSDPASYSMWARDVWDMAEPMIGAWGALGRLSTADRQLGSARAAVASTVKVREQLAPLQPVDDSPAWTAPVAYPASTTSQFPARLAALAEMIDRDLPLRVVALDANGGYDTHENQAAALDRDLDLLAASLSAFQADLEARGIADRVLVHVWSEFGRRPRENGSGTDHGAGGASLLMGTRVAGGIIGEFPGLGTLDPDGNLRSTVDFRAVYRGLLEQWLQVDPTGLLPGASSFTAPKLVA